MLALSSALPLSKCSQPVAEGYSGEPRIDYNFIWSHQSIEGALIALIALAAPLVVYMLFVRNGSKWYRHFLEALALLGAVYVLFQYSIFAQIAIGGIIGFIATGIYLLCMISELITHLKGRVLGRLPT